MSDEYASVEKFKARLVAFNNVSAEQATDLEDIIEAASRAVDRYLDVPTAFFIPPTSSTPKTLRGRGNTYIALPMPLFGSVTIVAPSGFTVPNFTVEDMRLITLDDSDNPTDTITWDNIYYTATGLWGYSETPAEIREATLQIGVHFYRGRDKALSGTIMDMKQDEAFPERDYPRATRRLLDDFKRNLGGEPGGELIIV